MEGVGIRRAWQQDFPDLFRDRRKTTILADGYASWKATYDSFSRVTDERYFGPSGEPVLHKKGLHGSMTGYDRAWKSNRATFIGLEGKAIVSATVMRAGKRRMTTAVR